MKLKKLSAILSGTFLLMGGYPTTTIACSVCFFGDPSAKANLALKMSVATLLAVLSIVLGALLTFIFSFCKRSRTIKPNA